MHSQLTAKIAGRLLPASPMRDAAIVAGLLHDIGKLVLATRSPQHFARAIQESRVEKIPLYEAEQRLMGVSHAEVGAYLLGLWGLPAPVVEAVANHHVPGRIRMRRWTMWAPCTSRTCWPTSIRCTRRWLSRLPSQPLDAEFLNAAETCGPNSAVGRNRKDCRKWIAQSRRRGAVNFQRIFALSNQSIWRRTYCKIPPCW